MSLFDLIYFLIYFSFSFLYHCASGKPAADNTSPHPFGLFPNLLSVGAQLVSLSDEVVERAAYAEIELLGTDEGLGRVAARLLVLHQGEQRLREGIQGERGVDGLGPDDDRSSPLRPSSSSAVPGGGSSSSSFLHHEVDELGRPRAGEEVQGDLPRGQGVHEGLEELGREVELALRGGGERVSQGRWRFRLLLLLLQVQRPAQYEIGQRHELQDRRVVVGQDERERRAVLVG